MRQQDWAAVIGHHIREAGGDPRWVLKSTDEELEKIALSPTGIAGGAGGVVRAIDQVGHGVATLLGRGAGAPGRLMSRISEYGRGLGRTFEAARAGRPMASGGARMAEVARTPLRQGAKVGPVLNLDATPATARHVIGLQGSRSADRLARVPVHVPGSASGIVPAVTAPGATAAAAGAKGAKTAKKTADEGMFSGLQKWWGNAETPAWQKYGLVAGGAAVPAIGAGLMMGGGNGGGGTTIIQR